MRRSGAGSQGDDEVKNKQPLFILAAGVACALIAAFAVKKVMGSNEMEPEVRQGASMLVATRDIEYGEFLVLDGTGEGANVVLLTEWPKSLPLEGAITDGARITEQPMRALTFVLKHTPVLSRHIIPEDEICPPGMYVEKINVPGEDVSSGRLSPGMKVDIVQILHGAPQSFMQNVRIYAVGSVDSMKRPIMTDQPAPNVFLVVKKDDRMAFLKAKLADSFHLMEAAEPDGEGPLLVDASATEQGRRDEVQALLNLGRTLVNEQQYDKALPVFEDAAARYPELTALCAEADVEAGRCRKRMAQDILAKAERAADQGDYTTAMRWLDDIEADHADVADVMAAALTLRRTTQKDLEKSRAVGTYLTLLADAESHMDKGDLPAVRRDIEEIGKIDKSKLLPEGYEPSPQVALADLTGRLKKQQSRYSIDRTVFDSQMKQADHEAARRTLEAIKRRFPEHPAIGSLEKQLGDPETIAES